MHVLSVVGLSPVNVVNYHVITHRVFGEVWRIRLPRRRVSIERCPCVHLASIPIQLQELRNNHPQDVSRDALASSSLASSLPQRRRPFHQVSLNGSPSESADEANRALGLQTLLDPNPASRPDRMARTVVDHTSSTETGVTLQRPLAAGRNFGLAARLLFLSAGDAMATAGRRIVERLGRTAWPVHRTRYRDG